MAGYVTAPPDFVRGKLRARKASSFCDFWIMTSCDFRAFHPFRLKQTLTFVIYMCLIRSIKAYLCVNMINFDAVDFSECRFEEVISLYWLSVYLSDKSVLWNCTK